MAFAASIATFVGNMCSTSSIRQAATPDRLRVAGAVPDRLAAELLDPLLLDGGHRR